MNDRDTTEDETNMEQGARAQSVVNAVAELATSRMARAKLHNRAVRFEIC